ncbi:ribosome maturation factor RimP [Clostridium ljungdahlii]|uniref:Ribosome maturation factor RimP n=1 Tax=Clostridium ljungdahlii TaxID=1538 RepID=A0A168L7L9_9CLOT|nr:ribosome maturation factor RimP [Clostridium ljungdahlii]OAA82775.1 Ribosome maturation factor RimP [Clostridium ljungdahlii]
MTKNTFMERMSALIQPIVHNLNYELYYLEFKKEGNNNYLRIYIDKKEGNISLEDCENVSRAVSDMLDKEDPIKDPYYLEVSSPGVERKLYTEEHLKRYIGYSVEVNISGLLKGKKKYEGELLDFNADELKIKCEEEDIAIPRDKILNVNLKGDF